MRPTIFFSKMFISLCLIFFLLLGEHSLTLRRQNSNPIKPPSFTIDQNLKRYIGHMHIFYKEKPKLDGNWFSCQSNNLPEWEGN